MQQFEKSFADINQSMLPETKLPDPLHITAAGAVHKVLWAVAGAVDPFDWDTLDLAVGPSLDAVQVTRELVGDLWTRWYPESPPLGPAVVPRQLALLVNHCLGNIKQLFESKESQLSIQPLAAKADVARIESVKRLRIA